MNNLRLIVLKFSTFANYNLNVYFLRIIATNVSKFKGELRPLNLKFQPQKWSQFFVLA